MARAMMLLTLWSCTANPDPAIAPSLFTVTPNEHNPFSAVVTVSYDDPVMVWAEAGEGGAFDIVTPPIQLDAGSVGELLLLGLRADRTFDVRVVATSRGQTWTSEPLWFTTDPLPLGFPDVVTHFAADPSSFDPAEIVCTDGRRAGPGRPLGVGMYYCVDRDGVPVWSIEHPDGDTLLEVEPTADGGFAAVDDTRPRLVLFDARGAVTAEYEPSWFDERGRFRHLWIDSHEVLQLREGPWAGALAVLTGVGDTVGDGTFLLGNGIVVFDPVSAEILWDWTSHGDLGDGVPIDPALSYDRASPIEEQADWQHANALVHGLDLDGGQFFWMSLRHQDWIIKIDVETDAIVWRLGHEGDIELVDDLDAAAPTSLSPAGWMFHQHAPEIVRREGERITFVVFDNGNLRPDADGAWDLDATPYSRVAAFEIDEGQRRASPTFAIGGFYSDIRGDADVVSGGERLQYLVSRTDPPTIVEVTYPGLEEVWRMEVPVGSAPYRMTTFESLYEMD